MFVKSLDSDKLHNKTSNMLSMYANNKNTGGTNVTVIEMDMLDPTTMERKFSKAMKENLDGRLDAAFLCHGVVVEKNLANCSTINLDQTMLINVRSNV